MILVKNEGNKNDYQLIKVSLSTGKAKELYKSVTGFSLGENQIICNNSGGGFISVDYNGNEIQRYSETGSVLDTCFNYVNEYVYYTYNSKLYRLNVNTGTTGIIDDSHLELTEINNGLTYLTGSKLTIINYDGKEIATILP